MALEIHVDGGARGNPGPAGAGVLIRDEQRVLHEAGYFLGTQTNNAAEYTALILALQRAARLPAQPLRIFSDSELLVRQITGEYQVKSPTLEKLYQQAQLLLLKVSSWAIRHVRREHNKRADELANLAMDQGRTVIVTDVEDDEAAAPPPPPVPQPAPPQQPPGTAAPAAPGDSAEAAEPAEAPRPVWGRCTTPPHPGSCPAPPARGASWTIAAELPAGLCVYAAHAMLPTLLAIQNADSADFDSIPPLTVRCAKPGCGAAFSVSPPASGNGRH